MSILAGTPPADRDGPEPNARPPALPGDRPFVASRCLADPVLLDEEGPELAVLNAARDADSKHVILKSGNCCAGGAKDLDRLVLVRRPMNRVADRRRSNSGLPRLAQVFLSCRPVPLGATGRGITRVAPAVP